MIMRTVIWWIMWLVGAGGPPSQQQVHEPQALDRALAGATAELVGLSVPSASAFTTGDREIKAGSTAVGPVAVIGTLRVSGTIDGDAFAYGGDVVLLPGSHVTGSAVALEGRVRDEGGHPKRPRGSCNAHQIAAKASIVSAYPQLIGTS